MSYARKIWGWLQRVDAVASSWVASRTVRVLEIELLLFPVFVVLLASAALLFGGRCALWQWWAAVVAAISVGWFHSRSTRPFYLGSGLFLFSLLALWVACGISIVPLGDDPLRYHLPGIRLLTEGWNPVWQGRWDQITAAFGIDPSETKDAFLLPTAKGVWYLDAVAYLFVQNPFNLMLPAYFLLAAVSCVTLFRHFGHVSVFLRVAMYFAMIKVLPACSSSIDAVVGFSGICLFMAMSRYVTRREWDWIELLGYSFWMCGTKQTGAFHCFVFWGIFSLLILWRFRWNTFRRFCVAAAALAISWCLVSTSPYLAAWKGYGHPLYPKCTVDPMKYPVRDIVTCDFLLRNDDAACMGHLGAYLRAYVSSACADMYYNTKLGRRDFSPDGLTWHFGQGYPDVGFRVAFCGFLLLLLLLGRKEDRMVAGMLVAGSAAMPTEMIGYWRYCPWMTAGVVFAMPVLAHGRWKFLRCLILALMVVIYSLQSVKETVADCGCKIAYAKSSMDWLEKTPIKVLFNGHTEEKFASREQEYFDIFFSEKNTTKRGDDVNKTSLGNLKLLQRQSPYLAKSRIVDFTMGGAEASRFRASNGTWKSFYDNSFKLSPEEPLPPLESAAETVLHTFPELLLRRLTGRFAWN